jgi:hypothetical protein
MEASKESSSIALLELRKRCYDCRRAFGGKAQ